MGLLLKPVLFYNSSVNYLYFLDCHLKTNLKEAIKSNQYDFYLRTLVKKWFNCIIQFRKCTPENGTDMCTMNEQEL